MVCKLHHICMSELFSLVKCTLVNMAEALPGTSNQAMYQQHADKYKQMVSMSYV